MKSWHVALERIKKVKDYSLYKIERLQQLIGGDIGYTNKDYPYLRRKGKYTHDIMYNSMKDNYTVYYHDLSGRRHIIYMEEEDLIKTVKKTMEIVPI